MFVFLLFACFCTFFHENGNSLDWENITKKSHDKMRGDVYTFQEVGYNWSQKKAEATKKQIWVWYWTGRIENKATVSGPIRVQATHESRINSNTVSAQQNNMATNRKKRATTAEKDSFLSRAVSTLIVVVSRLFVCLLFVVSTLENLRTSTQMLMKLGQCYF